MYIEEKELSLAPFDYTCCLHDWLSYTKLEQGLSGFESGLYGTANRMPVLYIRCYENRSDRCANKLADWFGKK